MIISVLQIEEVSIMAIPAVIACRLFFCSRNNPL